MNKKVFMTIKKAEEEKILKLNSSEKVEKVNQTLCELMHSHKGDTQLFKALFEITAEFLSAVEEVKKDYFELGRVYKDVE
ncbi:hypothetical protein DW663_01290 [Fusobacterium mortiferum]|uniref:Uncharacterized protein n=1 Tax=Fusobacterium mortiferum TaxID=850 RepID=A0A414Q2L1_FUSMR|nr:hypothetical protein [Fusobacterium mortiferum]RHF75054.1 hypothetical protein DW663_01290 [Fusobacterium mortiferum]